MLGSASHPRSPDAYAAPEQGVLAVEALPTQARAPKLVRYLATLNTAQCVLWCYLIWYLIVLIEYFDPSPTLWLSSLGLSAIIGTALYLSTTRAGRTKTRLGFWPIARFYIMPLCVSSFAALIKGQGFVTVFHPSWQGNAKGAAACAAFLALHTVLKRIVAR
jgi:hypothetical protein